MRARRRRHSHQCPVTNASSCTTSLRIGTSSQSRMAKGPTGTPSSVVADVSRETSGRMSMSTLEVEPEVAASLLGDRIDIARAFTASLAAQGEERGLIGPLELPRLWTRHVLNSAIAAPLVHGSTADIGSGAGLPGLVIAIARPDVKLTLIEPMERRVTWLNEQVTELGLDNVTVLRSRAE